MTDTNLTHIYFLLDRSGSMQAIQEATVTGFAAFVGEQRQVAGRCRVTLAQFDTRYEEIYADIPIAEVGPLDLRPRGSTALLDSIGRLVNTAGQRLAALPEDERPGTVIVAIMTDGMENASREFTYAQIRALIEQQTDDYAWQFLYMGANQDAIEVGARIGVAADHSITYAPDAAAEAFAASSASMASYRDAMAAGMPAPEARRRSRFTDDQRKQAGG